MTYQASNMYIQTPYMRWRESLFVGSRHDVCKNPSSLALLARLLLPLNLPPLLHNARHLGSNLAAQLIEPLDHAVRIAIAQLLAHLELAAHVLNLDLQADDVLLHDVDVRLRRIGHLPRRRSAALARVAHRDLLVEARQRVNLPVQKRRRLLGAGVDVEGGLAVDLHGGVVPGGHDLCRRGFRGGVELGRDVVVHRRREHDQHVLLQRPRVVAGGLALLDLLDDGLGLRVGAGHVRPQAAELRLAGFILDVQDEGDVAGLDEGEVWRCDDGGELAQGVLADEPSQNREALFRVIVAQIHWRDGDEGGDGDLV